MTYHYVITPSSCSRNHYHPKHGGGGGAGCTSLSLTPPPCEAILNIPPLSGPGVRGATAKNQGHQNLPMENLHSDLELSIGDEPTIPVWQNHPKTKVKPIEIVFIWNASTIGTKTISLPLTLPKLKSQDFMLLTNVLTYYFGSLLIIHQCGLSHGAPDFALRYSSENKISHWLRIYNIIILVFWTIPKIKSNCTIWKSMKNHAQNKCQNCGNLLSVIRLIQALRGPKSHHEIYEGKKW